MVFPPCISFFQLIFLIFLYRFHSFTNCNFSHYLQCFGCNFIVLFPEMTNNNSMVQIRFSVHLLQCLASSIHKGGIIEGKISAKDEKLLAFFLTTRFLSALQSYRSFWSYVTSKSCHANIQFSDFFLPGCISKFFSFCNYNNTISTHHFCFG